MAWARVKNIFRYLKNLEWNERVQHVCKFCGRANFKRIVYEDDQIIAIENIRLAGQFHWLIMPKAHLRDTENLKGEHLPILQAMDDVKHRLLNDSCPDIPRSAVLSGYHRGRRPLFRDIYLPDIVSIHHLHLHVIVRPQWHLRLFKYPSWFPLMWKSDAAVMQEVRRLA